MKNTQTNKQPAFTMIELVMVIVVLGILAALALPRMERDLRQEAETNIVSALRYTKNLALSDDKTDPRDSTWQQELWQLRFSQSDAANNQWFYTIFSDTSKGGNADKNETFVDPQNGKFMFHTGGDATLDESDESPNIFISKKYGVNSVTFTAGAAVNQTTCAGAQYIAFDNLGRPHASIGTATHLFEGYVQTNCIITIGFESSGIADLIITIEAETGHISTN